MMRRKRGRGCRSAWLAGVLLLCGQLAPALAAPGPGDVFREYRWTNVDGDAGGSLRVGGEVGYDGSNISWGHAVDLRHATRAEVVIEKLLCHDRTRGLAISVNDHPWILVPEAEGIPQPQWEYQHHFYPVVELPLEQLSEGKGNQFRMQVDETSRNWPQNLVYGVHLRVYYDAAKKPHATGQVTLPAGSSVLGAEAKIGVEITGAVPIRRVDYLGLYDGVNLEGDGRYRQWHYHYRQAELAGHIGTATSPPWSATWDTSWIPDQVEPMQLAAWITDDTGLTTFTDALTNVTLDRSSFSVELCKPYDVPRMWLTRKGEHSENFCVEGDLSKATAAKLVWVSWSPGYLEGVFVNGHQVLDREGPRYAYFAHDVDLPDLDVLKPGENVLTTGHTPKHNGKMVHGAEINWPGIMVLVRYE